MNKEDISPKMCTVGASSEVRERGRLLHIERGGATYFLTFAARPGESFSPEERKIVLDSCKWGDGSRWVLHGAVVMPDHVHIVAGLNRGSLAKIMHGFKGYTAYRINELLKQKGSFWQPQYHDHAVRQDEDLNEVVLYTLNNPVRAGLANDFHEYPYWFCRWSV